MTALPAVADATGATRNEGQFKAYMTSEHDYLAGLFGTDGVPATALATLGALGATYVAKTGAYTVVTGDRGKVIACSGTWTLGLTAVATLGAGYSCIIANTSTGTITIDPASAELIDGAATFALGARRMVLIVCTGSAWITLALAGSVTTSSLDTTAGRLVKTGDFGLGQAISLTASDNLDALVTSGLFYNPAGSNCAGNNYPIAAAGALIVVYRQSNNFVQKFVSHAGSGSTAASVREFTRSYGGSVWSPWVELFHQGTVLGTVSQSGGVPTGKVIERGSNANGEYVRFADGTQICTLAVSRASTSIATAFMGGFKSTDYTWTFPAAFVAAPAVSFRPTGLTGFDGGVNTVSTTAATVFHTAIASQSAATLTGAGLAIGRWF